MAMPNATQMPSGKIGADEYDAWHKWTQYNFFVDLFR